MKEYLKTIPATTLIIIYLYLCGGLYLIAYWSTFNFDISNIVGIIDIPKSFIFPFILSNVYFILQSVVADLISKPVAVSELKFIKYSVRHFIMDTIAYGIAIGLLTVYMSYKYNSIYWGIACLYFLLLFAYKFGKSHIVNTYLPTYNMRYYVGTLIITVPIFCVFTAKLSSLSIYNNNDIRFIKTINDDNSVSISDTLSLKLLGFLGDKVIVGSLDNKKITVINQSSFNRIELTQKDKK